MTARRAHSSGVRRRGESGAFDGELVAIALVFSLSGMACTVTRNLGDVRRDAGPEAHDPDRRGDDDGGPGPICAHGSPGVRLGSGDQTCADDLAARTFKFALCSCVDLDLGAGFRTDSFDGHAGPYTPEAALSAGGGPVGINGAASIRAGAEVQGTLVIAGSGTSSIGDAERINGDLKTNGDLEVGRSVLVRRDAWIRGGITAPDGVTIAGDLWQPPGAPTPSGLVLGGAQRVADVTIPPPCACAPGDADAIALAVADARMTNDNASAVLGAGDLTDPPADAAIALPCGRFYVDQVSGSAPTTLLVQGHAALFVGGDFTAWDGLQVQFVPGGELDVFVAGTFSLGSATTWGDPLHAAALRIYVAGATASMANATTFAGNLYAPVATVAAQSLEIFGSIVAGGLRSENGIAIHFDRAVLGAAAACMGAGPTACTSCSDCLGTDGCSHGVCGGCQTDLDCCDPLVCSNQRCIALVF
jgi:hypothetical protein